MQQANENDGRLYSCQTGNQYEAWEWPEDAFDLASDATKTVKPMALNDRDLEPPWAGMAG